MRLPYQSMTAKISTTDIEEMIINEKFDLKNCPETLKVSKFTLNFYKSV